MSQLPGDLSRREFLKTFGVLGAGALVARSAGGEEPAKEKDRQATVPMRPFGKTGEKISALSLGGMFDVPNNQLLLKQALGFGVTCWDTADVYMGGRSESGFGQYFSKNADSRKQVFLVTKALKGEPAAMTDSLNQSLERMQTDYVDLYMLGGVKDPSELNDDVKGWVSKAKAAKKIRFFGFSTHQNMAAKMTASSRLGWIDGVLTAYNFRLMHDDAMKAALDACTKAGIGLIAMKSMGGGPGGEAVEAALKLLEHFGGKGFSPQQAKLKAVWEDQRFASICVLMPNLTVLMANVAVAVDKVSLSASDREALQQYAAVTRGSYCAGCTNICEDAIGGTAPIGDVMRSLMYSRSYGNPRMASDVFESLSREQRAQLITLNYSVSERQCPQGLPIGKLIVEATELFGQA